MSTIVNRFKLTSGCLARCRTHQLVHCALRRHEWACRLEFVPYKVIEPSNTHAHLEGLCLGFHLKCYPLFLGSNWSQEVMSSIMTSSSAAARVFQYFSRLKSFSTSNSVSETIFNARPPQEPLESD
jgi:hypothetical protein